MGEIDSKILDRAKKWLEGNYDDHTKSIIRDLIKNNPTELTDAFYKDLEFGTGGLRGIMGVGTNRMNKYTVGMATQGLANYLNQKFGDLKQIKIAIAFDSRNNNTYFARITSDVLSANGIKVYLFDDLRPTPELSFAIRYLGCQSGIVITASHNPKEYNGYKVYWDDGGQLVYPHDINVIHEVKKIGSIDDVNFHGKENLIEIIGESIDYEYLLRLKQLSLSPDIIKRHHDMKIVYTPIHGTGVKLVPMALRTFGFTNILNVPEQDIVSGNFPTVHSPNPEEPAAMELAIKRAKETSAQLVMATDPDADRVGIAVRANNGNFVLLNGNQTASLLIFYLLTKWKENGKLTGSEYIAKTIVTSEILKEINNSKVILVKDYYTGFKYIAELIRNLEGSEKFIGGGEESYGYLIGDFVRDKDAVISCCMIAETAAWAEDKGLTLYEMLIDIYTRYGFYLETLISVVKKGKQGAEEIQQMMDNFRNQPPKEINNSKVILVKDYYTGIEHDMIHGSERSIDLPKSNVLQFFLEDGSKITVRPSGTEPKIKFYFGVKDDLSNKSEFDSTRSKLEKKIEGIIKSLGLN